MSFSTPDICKYNVDSLDLVKKQSAGKPRRMEMEREYKRLLKHFLLLCSGCNQIDSRIRSRVWIERVRQFVGHLTTFVLPLTDDAYFGASVWKMLCHTSRCKNLSEWPKHLNRDFFNWFCHKTAYTGYELLGIREIDTRGMGAPGSDAMINNVKILVFQACELAPKSGLRARVTLANEAFSVAHNIRQLRVDHSQRLCGEIENRSHCYQRCLMLALYEATQEWLES
jgi:hypothetical protein